MKMQMRLETRLESSGVTSGLYYLNCHGFRRSASGIQDYLKDENVHIIALQEHGLRSKNNIISTHLTIITLLVFAKQTMKRS